MKQLLTISFILILFSSCKKDLSYSEMPQNYAQRVKKALYDSIPGIYGSLDLSRGVKTKYSKDTFFLRIPFKGKTLANEFVLLQTNQKGNITRGRIIQIQRIQEANENPFVFNGHISIRNLKGAKLTDSPIENGLIKAFHPDNTSNRLQVVPDNSITLSEVIVTATRRTSGVSFGSWLLLMPMFTGGPSGGVQGMYSSMGDPGGGGSGTGSGGGPTGDIYLEPFDINVEFIAEEMMEVDYEYQIDNSAIDLQKYLDCFNKITDAGSNCSIEIFTDIPVDKDPYKLFTYSQGYAGHTFLQIKKSNGNQSAMQNIGFYPVSGWKTLISPAPVDGKFVDNSDHEFNASFKVNISPEQLKAAITHLLNLERFVKYDIDDYNCTDLAVEVFNVVRHPTQQLLIPRYAIPGGMAPAGTSTPQGVYNKLLEMQQSGHPEASNISIPGYKGWVSTSSGPCN